MTKKLQKSVRRQCSIGMIGIFALGVGLGLPLLSHGAESPTKKVPNIHHELVPHVILPETIQYNKTAKNSHSLSGLSKAGDYGMVSPHVATYLPFPSYQIPYAAEMKTVNQSVYPVSPKRLPLPPKKTVDAVDGEKDSVISQNSELESQLESELTTVETDSSFGDTEVAPILLASNSEEVVQAVPLDSWNNTVTQTGIFCAKPPKQPTAWSFTSPIFKAASVPMGAGNPAGNIGYNGFINQYNSRGCGTQVGFQPIAGAGIAGGENGVPMPYPPFPMGQGMNTGVQTQILPNGMILLTVPPDHTRCGLLRCYGHHPRTLLLPAGSGVGVPGAGMPGAGNSGVAVPGVPQSPPPMPPTPPSAMMLPGISGYAPMQAQYPLPTSMPTPMPIAYPNQFPALQSQIVPVTTMTPYGLVIAGYQRVPVANPSPLNDPRMYGMGMGMISAQQLQALQLAQHQQMSGMPQQLQQSTDEQDENSNELKTPLPINSPSTNTQTMDIPSVLNGLSGLLANSYADPYSLYAQQFGATNQTGTQNMNDNTANLLATQPFMLLPPQANYGNHFGMVGQSYSGVCMTPYGMMVLPSAMPMNGYGLMPVGMSANVSGFPGNPVQGMGVNQGGLSLSDVVQLVMLLNNNNQRHRSRLFERIAERRALRRERHAQHDPLNLLMQAWTTPYVSPTDSTVRMPSRNTYPYGYFGAQAGQQDSANYGGYYNLYMGNTSYPGLY